MRPGDDARRREGAEPHEAPRNIPIGMVLLTVSIAIWGGWYFWMYAGDGGIQHGDLRSLSALRAPSKDAAVDGANVYNTKCKACHQATGQGLPGAFPPLAGSEWVLGPPQRPIAVVLHGLKGPIQVAGNDFVSAMPPQPLNNDEIAAVLTFVRSSWGNSAEPITSDTVKNVRERLQSHEAPITGGAELKTLFP